MADPNALSVTVAAMQAVHFLGMPEGNLALAGSGSLSLTLPPSPTRSSTSATAGEVVRDAQETMAELCPLASAQRGDGTYGEDCRLCAKGINTPTPPKEKLTDMQCLPDNLKKPPSIVFRPTDQGLAK